MRSSNNTTTPPPSSNHPPSYTHSFTQSIDIDLPLLLLSPNNDENVTETKTSPISAAQILRGLFVQYVWIRGGHLFPTILWFIQPKILSHDYDNDTGEGCCLRRVGLLHEELYQAGTTVDDDDESNNDDGCFVRYRVVTPGLIYGYPVFQHDAMVRFSIVRSDNDTSRDDDDGGGGGGGGNSGTAREDTTTTVTVKDSGATDNNKDTPPPRRRRQNRVRGKCVWQVTWDPYPYWGWYVSRMTRFVVNTLLENYSTFVRDYSST